MTKNWKNLRTAGSKFAVCLSLSLHKGRPNYRWSLQASNKNIQHFEILSFFFFVGHFWTPGSGSTDLIETGSNPDPKHYNTKTSLNPKNFKVKLKRKKKVLDQQVY